METELDNKEHHLPALRGRNRNEVTDQEIAAWKKILGADSVAYVIGRRRVPQIGRKVLIIEVEVKEIPENEPMPPETVDDINIKDSPSRLPGLEPDDDISESATQDDLTGLRATPLDLVKGKFSRVILDIRSQDGEPERMDHNVARGAYVGRSWKYLEKPPAEK